MYVPAQYVAGTPAPFIVVQDGMSATYRNNLPPILDNLIHEKRVPAMAAVMVHNGGGDAQGSQRGLEYDTVSGVYTDFIETEVLPRVSKEYGIVFTRDPEGRATMGGSSGAACAFTMAWFHPELYRRVLSYSGTYVNQQSPLNPESPRGRVGVSREAHPENPAKPMRIWMHVSEYDNGYFDQEETWHNWVLANDRMAAALKAKGYEYQVRVLARLAPRRSRGRVADAARGAGVAVEGLPTGQAVNRRSTRRPRFRRRRRSACGGRHGRRSTGRTPSGAATRESLLDARRERPAQPAT